jgi:hypothetical protein
MNSMISASLLPSLDQRADLAAQVVGQFGMRAGERFVLADQAAQFGRDRDQALFGQLVCGQRPASPACRPLGMCGCRRRAAEASASASFRQLREQRQDLAGEGPRA